MRGGGTAGPFFIDYICLGILRGTQKFGFLSSVIYLFLAFVCILEMHFNSTSTSSGCRAGNESIMIREHILLLHRNLMSTKTRAGRCYEIERARTLTFRYAGLKRRGISVRSLSTSFSLFRHKKNTVSIRGVKPATSSVEQRALLQDWLHGPPSWGTRASCAHYYCCGSA